MKMHLNLFVCAAILASLIGCSDEQKAPVSEEKSLEIVQSSDDRAKIEKAHNKENFTASKAIEFEIVLSFGGKERLNGKMTLATNSSAGKIEYATGKTLLYNSSGIFHSDSMGTDGKLKFAAYTWSYFFLFPYKLSDPGTNWKKKTLPVLREGQHNGYQLTFDSGIGEAPDDWYKIYANSKNNLIDVAAYIVTENKSKAKAEEDPHAIKYSDYRTINDVPIAHNWSFWGWTQDSALTEQLGEATLSNVQFVDVDKSFFEPSNDLIQIP